MNSPLGIGVISFAHGHAHLYCERLATFDDARLVACWDDNSARGRQAAERHGMRFVPQLEELLVEPAVEAVIVTCETYRHAEKVLAAAASTISAWRLVSHVMITPCTSGSRSKSSRCGK